MLISPQRTSREGGCAAPYDQVELDRSEHRENHLADIEALLGTA